VPVSSATAITVSRTAVRCAVLGLEHAATEALGAASLAAAVLAGEHAAAERRPGDDPQAERLPHRQQVLLRRALDQAVLDLEPGDRGRAAQLRNRRRPRDAPGREVGEPRMEDLAGPHEIVEAAHDLLDRRHAVGVVHPIQINPLRLGRPAPYFPVP
jgi:hypothetical protein